MKKRLVLAVACSTMLSGCVVTDMAKDYLTDMQDTNRYETARETASNVCTQDVLDRLDRFLGEDVANVIKKKCSEKRVVPQPLN